MGNKPVTPFIPRCTICRCEIDLAYFDAPQGASNPQRPAIMVFEYHMQGEVSTYRAIHLVCKGACDRRLREMIGDGPRYEVANKSANRFDLSNNELIVATPWTDFQPLALKPHFDSLCSEISAIATSTGNIKATDRFMAQARGLYLWLRERLREPQTTAEVALV